MNRTAGQNEVTALPFTLRSHEKSTDGFNVEATYTILKDGQPLGFIEHCNAVSRLNDYPKLVEDRAKLVEALRDSISDLQTMERHYPESAKTVLERRRALLRSLDEDARSHGARV